MKINKIIEDILYNIEMFPVLDSETGVTSMKYKYGDIRRYGAKQIEGYDNSTALQNAINSWDEVFIPNGKFLINSTCYLKPNIHIHGESINSVLYTDSDIVIFKNNTTNRYDGLKMCNFTLYKNLDNATKELMNCTNIAHSSFNDLYIRKTGTNSTGSIGLKIGNDVMNSRSYYNTFDSLKIDGFDLGVDINSASNANTFIACRIINCKNGMNINKTNSTTLLNVGFEMLTENGINVSNGSFYNNFIACRFESCVKSISILYSSTASSYNNYIYGGLDYSTEGMNIETSNILVGKNSKILTNTEYNSLTKNRTRISAYKSTAVQLTANNEITFVFDKTNTDTLNEFNKSTGIFTPTEDGTYSFNVNFAIPSGEGKVYLYVNGSKNRYLAGGTTQISGGCSVFLTAGSTCEIKIVSTIACTIQYEYSNNRVDIVRI